MKNNIHGLTADGRVIVSGPRWIERETDEYERPSIRETATTNKLTDTGRSEETTRRTIIEVPD